MYDMRYDMRNGENCIGSAPDIDTDVLYIQIYGTYIYTYIHMSWRLVLSLTWEVNLTLPFLRILRMMVSSSTTRRVGINLQ